MSAINVRHARKNGRALCATSGSAGGFHVVTVSAKEWNALDASKRCAKCVAKLQLASLRASHVLSAALEKISNDPANNDGARYAAKAALAAAKAIRGRMERTRPATKAAELPHEPVKVVL